jgi:2-keto-4-pentenoate hydratase/2-oxohepta-3-ene-1,7-dioic acid hydratase in catechol pathway
MTTHLVRFRHAGAARWGVVLGARIAPLDGEYPTTAALIATGEADWRAAAARAPSLDVAAVTPLSPVTAPARVICQGANYRQHMIESGVDPDAKRFNMFFEKSDASISAPAGAIVRPAHVRLLDYEIELALVMRKLVLPEPQLWRAFVRAQGNRPEYLRPGDAMRATIASADRAIDLGEQRHTIEGAQ